MKRQAGPFVLSSRCATYSQKHMLNNKKEGEGAGGEGGGGGEGAGWENFFELLCEALVSL